MQYSFWRRCFFNAIGLCLIAQPLIGAQDMSSGKMMMSQEMTESDLLKQMDKKDMSTYQDLSPEGKDLILKMVNMTKMNNNPMMIMQKCISMMDMMMSKMDMMEKKDMMNMQKK